MKRPETLRMAAMISVLALVTGLVLLLPVWYERLQEPRRAALTVETLGSESLQTAAATTAQTLALLADPGTVWTDLSGQTGAARVEEVGRQFAEQWADRADRRDKGMDWESLYRIDPMEILLYGGDPMLMRTLTPAEDGWALVSLRGTVEGRACSALLWCLQFELEPDGRYDADLQGARASVLADPETGVIYRATLTRAAPARIVTEVQADHKAEQDGPDEAAQSELWELAALYWDCEPPEGLWPILRWTQTGDTLRLDFGGEADLERLSRNF
ncbi:MAG: hypothetical protein IJ484_02240 [Oscillospiraceae bacterium]|nr:hypothetical protein [Oscillospiraceae bacterium]